MAWNDVASNQMVSYLDASTSPFALNAGQSHLTTLPAANQCMDKTAMLTKYNLNAAILRASYESNQLVPKSAWATGVSAPIFIANGTATLFTGTSAPIPYPSTVLAGDFIILSVRAETFNKINVPSGFTLIPPDDANASLPMDYANYYKFASGSEGGTSVTVTSPSATLRICGMITQYRNVNTSIPFSPSPVYFTNDIGTTIFTNSAGTSSAANQLGVALFSISAPSISSVVSNAWTHRGGATFSAGQSHAFTSATQAMPTSGTSTGTFTVNVPAQTTGTMWTLFLNPV